MTVERYAALHDDDRSFVVDRSVELSPGEYPVVREWPPRQWQAANEYARTLNRMTNPPLRWPRLYPGHRPETFQGKGK